MVKPDVSKFSSKDRAGMFLSSHEMSTHERESTKESFLCLLKRLNKAIMEEQEIGSQEEAVGS